MVSSSNRRRVFRQLRNAGITVYVIFFSGDLVEVMSLGARPLHIFIRTVVTLGVVALTYAVTNHLLHLSARGEFLESKLQQLIKHLAMTSVASAPSPAPPPAFRSDSIEDTLRRWELTPAEKEIALLVLKGRTNKEIAQARKTSDHTIKQQTSAIYRKSGFKSRAEMSAHFLGELFPDFESTLAPANQGLEPTPMTLRID